ncbi:MAG: class I SAM-dependent methyltransferase [Acidobacteriota bacterium]|nr:class I SAM-dependent methyltransferase [Acidobacteriota bacterium]
MNRELLSNRILERSSVVANSLMNRERRIRGGNSYEKELGFDIIGFLTARLSHGEKPARWLDLCCGSGKALIEAASIFAEQKLNSRIEITGVDLAAMFEPYPAAQLDFLHLIESLIEDWKPGGEFDLITCVHGLHYIGDKLGLIQNAASWLKKDGVFTANLDLANFKFADDKPAGRAVAKELSRNGIEYKSSKHLIICRGKKEINPQKFRYLGADDKAGANYTGQAAVNSYYAAKSDLSRN